MRILMIAGITVVALIVSVVAIGYSLPRRHVVSRMATYRATPEQLYALITGTQSWRPDVLRYEVVPDSGGRELMRETTRNGETITYELLERTPNSIKRRIATADLPYSGTWTYTLHAERSVTSVRITEDGEVYNPVFRFVSRFVIGHTSTMDAYLRALGKAAGQEVQITN